MSQDLIGSTIIMSYISMIYLYFVSMQAMHLFIIIIILLIVMFMLWTSFLNLHYGAFLVQQHPELTDWRSFTTQARYFTNIYTTQS